MSLVRKFLRFVAAVRSRLRPGEHERYDQADRKLRDFDRTRLYHAKELGLVPGPSGRGRTPYGEWCHQLGIFQSLMHQHSIPNRPTVVVDIGCGLGKFVPAALTLPKPITYIGLDIRQKPLNTARILYPHQNVEFRLVEALNPFYNPENGTTGATYPVEGGSATLVTALSVWTHLSPNDAVHYFKEVERILMPGGRAIITFFVLGDEYQANSNKLSNTIHDFSEPFANSDHWFSSVKVDIPENMVAVTTDGIQEALVGQTSLELLETLPGFWTGSSGVFYQDVVVFEKPRE